MRGAVLVNSGKRGRKAKVVPLSRLFASVGGLKKNPLVANRRRKAKRTTRKGRRRNAGLSQRQKMSLLAQVRPRNSKGQFVKYKANGRKGRKGRRRNPLIANPLIANRGRKGRKGRKGGRRRNPMVLGQIAAPLRQIPIVGPALGTAVLSLAGAAAGAVAVYPTTYAMQHVGKYIPEQVQPFAYSIVGVLMAGLVQQFAPSSLPYKGMLVGALASAGGAVDAYRRVTDNSELSGADWGEDYGDWGDDDYGEDGDYAGDLGDDDWGDDENVRPGEWAGCSGYDAVYSGDDLSEEEIGYAGYGRRAYRRRFRKGGRRSQGQSQGQHGQGQRGSSQHAGKPGARFGWLIYMIGFQNFKQLAQMDRNRRKQIIAQLRNDVMQRVEAALQAGTTGGDTSMEAMEAAGLLAA